MAFHQHHAQGRGNHGGEVAGFGNGRTYRMVKEETVLDSQIGYSFQSGPLEGLSLTPRQTDVLALLLLGRDQQTMGTARTGPLSTTISWVCLAMIVTCVAAMTVQWLQHSA